LPAPVLPALATLLLCQLAGEAIVHAAALPVPGPVVGMMLLFGLLLIRAPLPQGMDDTADGILNHLSLLFVPAGVGVVQHLSLIGGEGFRLLVIILLSTIIALAVTALVFAAVAHALGQSGSPESPDGTP
jgi:holin-like protein